MQADHHALARHVLGVYGRAFVRVRPRGVNGLVCYMTMVGSAVDYIARALAAFEAMGVPPTVYSTGRTRRRVSWSGGKSHRLKNSWRRVARLHWDAADATRMIQVVGPDALRPASRARYEAYLRWRDHRAAHRAAQTPRAVPL